MYRRVDAEKGRHPVPAIQLNFKVNVYKEEKGNASRMFLTFNLISTQSMIPPPPSPTSLHYIILH